MGRWKLGGVTVDRICENEAPLLEPEVLFPDFDPEVFERHRSWLEPKQFDPATGLLILAFNSYVIRTRHHTILVDTCAGNDKERPQKPRYHMQSWPYLERLKMTGLTPADIDFVMCTHLHADHVGWNTRLVDGRWVPTFPNARYLFTRQEYEHWQNEDRRSFYTSDPFFRGQRAAGDRGWTGRPRQYGVRLRRQRPARSDAGAHSRPRLRARRRGAGRRGDERRPHAP